MWRLLIRGGWSTPYRAFPTAAERAAAPAAPAYALVGGVSFVFVCWAAWRVHRRVRSWRAGSPLGKEQRTVARRAVDRGWVRHAPGRCPADLGACGCRAPSAGRPYLGVIGSAPARTLAAELEVQPMVVAPPRAGKSTGYVVPWLLDHDGPALVLSTKRDIYDATAPVPSQPRPCLGV